MTEKDLIKFLINQLGYSKVLRLINEVLIEELGVRIEWSAYANKK